jgi:hypothetical protein
VHGLVTLFLEVIALATIFLVVGLVVPCILVIALTTICLDDDNQVDNRRDHVSCFNGNQDICGNGAACSSIHGYVR